MQQNCFKLKDKYFSKISDWDQDEVNSNLIPVADFIEVPKIEKDIIQFWTWFPIENVFYKHYKLKDSYIIFFNEELIDTHSIL